MHKIELTALRTAKLEWDGLVDHLPAALESIGLAHDDGASDGEAVVSDHGDEGCTILMPNVALARRLARALATGAGVDVDLFEVVGTAGEKRFRFRTTGWRATPAGELRAADGVELDLEDPEEQWGGGALEVRAKRVLDLFAELDLFAGRTLQLGYRRRAKPRPSSPRLATLLALLQKSKSFVAAPQADGRVALQVELATGGKQTSFCTQAENAELELLIVGKKPRAA